MGDIIVWKTAEEVMKIAGEMSKLVVGMSPEEAAVALNFTKAANGMFVSSIKQETFATACGSRVFT